MMALPRFLYALQNSLDVVPASYFKEIESLQRDLLWDSGPRIAFPKLTLNWYDGGISFPDIRKYYWATQLIAINHGTYGRQDDPGYILDKLLLPGGNYNRALYSRSHRYPLFGPTLHAVQAWHSANKHLGWEHKLTLATPLWASEQLGDLHHTKGFDRWDPIGISQIGDLWVNNTMATFDYLQQHYQLSDTEQYRYIQIRHAIRAHVKEGTVLPQASPLEDRLLDGYIPDKAISLVYKKLINNMADPLRYETDGSRMDLSWMMRIGGMPSLPQEL